MAVSGINNYKDAVFQWQAQQLKSTGQSSSKTSAASSLLNGQSMTSQLSSLVELTKYAMDAMGVSSSDSRVTFSQITKYRQQLQTEFSQSVKNGFAQSGISNLTGLSYSLDKSGKILVNGANANDRKSAQAWLDANPSFGQELRSALNAAGQNGEVDFTISSTGKISVVNNAQTSIQTELDKDSGLTETLRKAISEMGVKIDYPVAFSFDGDQLKATGENAEQINEWLSQNSDLANALKSQLDKKGIDGSAVTLRLGSTGNIQVNVNNADLNDVQKVLDTVSDVGSKINSGLKNMTIDPNINFTIQINEDGSCTVISDHPDAAKVQAFFDANPELVKKYRQIETLAGIDDARKAMQASPTEMRKRIQIESMMSWWASSSDASSYFGNYSDGSLSLLSGLNLQV